MICLGCGYELAGLGAGACPECGRAFDPQDSSSYAIKELLVRERRWWRLLVCAVPIAALWPVLVHAWVHLMLVVARLVLGHWPHRMGRDDPKYIAIVGEMHFVAQVAILITPLMVVAGLVGLGLIASRNRRVGLILTGAVAAAWIALSVVGDPAQVWVWFMD